MERGDRRNLLSGCEGAWLEQRNNKEGNAGCGHNLSMVAKRFPSFAPWVRWD